MYRHESASRVFVLSPCPLFSFSCPLCVLGSRSIMANASDSQEPWFFPYAGSRMHFAPAAISSSYAMNLYDFRRFQGLYATSGSINHLPPMESLHFRTNELGHAYRVMATATSDLDAQYRTCFENLDNHLELISSFQERVFEYLQTLSTQVVKALEAFQDTCALRPWRLPACWHSAITGTCVPSR